MTVEEVYTDAFDARLVAWTEIGNSPYLQNTDADYITTNADLREEGDWTFPASAGSGTINSVKLRLEARVSAFECGDVGVYVWDGSGWQFAGWIAPTILNAWYEIDVSAILNTWAKINGAEVYVHYSKLLTGVCTVRRLTRKVDYTTVTAKMVVQVM